MALEIERRFLVHGDAWRQHVRWQQRLEQGYLLTGGAATAAIGTSLAGTTNTGAADLTLRVRRSAEQAWLTLKARAPQALAPERPAALSRLEFEYPIPLADADALLALAPQRLAKWRYGLDLPGGDWVLDVFEGANAPLVVAEVELEQADQPLTIPPWCWREISQRRDLSNAALALHPLQQWPEADRAALLSPEGTEREPS